MNNVKASDNGIYFGLFAEESIPVTLNQEKVVERQGESGYTWFSLCFFLMVGSIFGTLLIIPVLLFKSKRLRGR